MASRLRCLPASAAPGLAPGLAAALVPALVAGLSLVLGLAGAGNATANNNSPGAKGAQIYCFMRANGHQHELSWIAAYALVKRQSASLFRTSPEHAAVMITEAVVQSPGSFPDCGRYLGDLYTRRMHTDTGAAPGDASPPPSGGTSSTGGLQRGGGLQRADRYGN
ncbi:MAG: DUF6554 family protein [Synechococcus sp.]|nr:DUF6554 family protein [Synechococcus sp.]